MYFYAVTLSLEALLRLGHYPKLASGGLPIHLLRLLLLVPLVIFGLQYFVTPLYRENQAPLPVAEQVLQIGTGVAAFLVSTIVHHHVVRREMKRIL